MAPTTVPIGSIRMCGPNTHHCGETLSVVADSEAAVRGIPDVVTVEQAEALVSRGEATWINNPRGATT
jgi:hypothetical protein